jgi:hypothetical protein
MLLYVLLPCLHHYCKLIYLFIYLKYIFFHLLHCFPGFSEGEIPIVARTTKIKTLEHTVKKVDGKLRQPDRM